VCRELAIAVTLSLGLMACSSADSEPTGGLYTWGHEVETFQPCGSTNVFWVVGETSLLQPLRDAADGASRTRPYQPVYVEVRAVSEGKANDGFASDYDGIYRFMAVAAVSHSAPPSCVADG